MFEGHIWIFFRNNTSNFNVKMVKIYIQLMLWPSMSEQFFNANYSSIRAVGFPYFFYQLNKFSSFISIYIDQINVTYITKNQDIPKHYRSIYCLS